MKEPNRMVFVTCVGCSNKKKKIKIKNKIKKGKKLTRQGTKNAFAI